MLFFQRTLIIFKNSHKLSFKIRRYVGWRPNKLCIKVDNLNLLYNRVHSLSYPYEAILSSTNFHNLSTCVRVCFLKSNKETSSPIAHCFETVTRAFQPTDRIKTIAPVSCSTSTSFCLRIEIGKISLQTHSTRWQRKTQ